MEIPRVGIQTYKEAKTTVDFLKVLILHPENE